jgi:hypothetical protein
MQPNRSNSVRVELTSHTSWIRVKNVSEETQLVRIHKAPPLLLLAAALVVWIWGFRADDNPAMVITAAMVILAGAHLVSIEF